MVILALKFTPMAKVTIRLARQVPLQSLIFPEDEWGGGGD